MKIEDRFRLDEKVAIVTGGAGAIGRVVARGLAEAGARVVLASRNAESAEEAVRALREDGFTAVAIRVDVSDRDSAVAMADQVFAEFGAVDALVNNAGLMAEIPQVDLLDMPPEWLERIIGVNLLGAIHCAAAVKPYMVERGAGRIVNISSAGAFMAGGMYSISKYALHSATVCLARSLGPYGVTVNTLAPGMVENGPGFDSLPADSPVRAAFVAQVPGRPSAPAEELMGLILLLTSEAGSWINGQNIGVDGGWMVRL
jgi:NAD(P)-dependent dehydrogenase (short-subunit alcohol dehydrogenase family)